MDIRELLEEVYDDVFDIVMPYDRYGAINFKEGHNYIEVTDFVANGHGSGCFINEEHERKYESDYDYMLECFIDDHKDQLPENITKENYWDVMNDDQKELMSDYESEWFEPTLLGMTIWDDGSMSLWMNCSDAPYYRSQYESTIVEVDEFEGEEPSPYEVVKAFTQRYRYQDKEAA